MLQERMAEVANEEFQLARTDLLKLSPQESLVRFYSRHDKRINAAVNTATVKPACGNNCSYCCYYKVEARAIEIFAIVEYVRKNYKSDQLQKSLVQAKRNVDEVKNLSYQEHMATNQACPFLMANSCSIYPVRPSKCRNFHASDVERCKESYEKPTDLTIPNSYVTEVFIASQAGSEAFEKAVELRGFDARMYDLNSAFVEAIENPKSMRRFRDGKKAFLNAKVVQVGEATAF